MSIIRWPNSNILANTSGLSTAICIDSLSGNHVAALTGGLAVYAALSVFKDAMREVAQERTAPQSAPDISVLKDTIREVAREDAAAERAARQGDAPRGCERRFEDMMDTAVAQMACWHDGKTDTAAAEQPERIRPLSRDEEKAPSDDFEAGIVDYFNNRLAEAEATLAARTRTPIAKAAGRDATP